MYEKEILELISIFYKTYFSFSAIFFIIAVISRYSEIEKMSLFKLIALYVLLPTLYFRVAMDWLIEKTISKEEEL